MVTNLLIIAVFPLAMALAAATDLFSMTVPNWISLLLVVGFAVLAPLVGFGWSDVGLHVALAAAALIVTFAMFSFGWLGPEVILVYGIYAALIGGVLTLLLLFLRNMPLPANLYSQGWLVRLHNPKEGIPYVIALAAAGLVVYPHTPFMAALSH